MGYLEIVECLLDVGVMVNVIDVCGCSVLYVVVQFGFESQDSLCVWCLFDVLFKCDVDVNYVDNEGKMLLLMLLGVQLCLGSECDVIYIGVLVLVLFEVGVWLEYVDQCGVIVLYVCVMYVLLLFVCVLLVCGVDWYVVDGFGCIVVDVVCYLGYVDIVYELVVCSGVVIFSVWQMLCQLVQLLE